MSLHRYLILTASLFFAVSPANAGGSVEVAQVLRLAGQSTTLMNEIHAELKKTNKALTEVPCAGQRLGRHWTNLGGLRIAPYICDFGTRTLHLTATVAFYADDGSVPKVDAEHEVARFVSESQPRWNWK